MINKSFKSSYQDYEEYKREEEFLDNISKLPRFIERLNQENITGILKQSAIKNFILDNALQNN